MKSLKPLFVDILGIVIIGLLVFVFGVRACHSISSTSQLISKKVDRKEAVNDKYLVYIDDQVLSNTDVVLRGKFNSSDIYNKIDEGKCYNFTLHGFRFRLFSLYKNILEVKEVSCQEK